MLKRIKENISVFVVKSPRLAILITIFILNIVLFSVAAAIISWLAPDTLVHSGFWASVFYTVSMILDAGTIEYVIADIGEASVVLIIICLITVLLGMITFTGAIVGYVTNYISNFIDNSKSGIRALKVSGHTVILNWNSRASEIINDLYYTGNKEVVVVLVNQDCETIEREIEERLASTIKIEQSLIDKESEQYSGIRSLIYRYKNRPQNKVTYIVRNGDTYSTKHLNDISISTASSIILMTKEYNTEVCKFSEQEKNNSKDKGNTNTIKTLVQVAEMTSREDSADNQTIIVEVEDEWTAKLVNRIIVHKEKLAKCHIIPVYINKVLGQILSQFSIMPELNTVYSELFSNRGAEFFYEPHEPGDDITKATRKYMKTHSKAIPLTLMETASGSYAFSMADSAADCDVVSSEISFTPQIELDESYRLHSRNIIIIGHNSKCRDIMNGFTSFRNEHNYADSEIMKITIIDDEKSLERFDYYKGYPYVSEVVPAEIFDSEKIKSTIERVVDSHEGDSSLLILSDDYSAPEDVDAAALTYLIYVYDIIVDRIEHRPGFKPEQIDVVIEILNPKNYDVVHNYDINNVVISNRYISKMVTQIGKKQALFEFYSDILSYDEEGAKEYVSKELYIKDVKGFFKTIPPRCTARELVWGVFEASPQDNKNIVLGYTGPGGKMVIFSGDQNDIEVELSPEDKLIVYSNH